HRGLAHLRPADLSLRRAGGAARAPARHRRLRQSDRHGAYARAVTPADLRRAPPRGEPDRPQRRGGARRAPPLPRPPPPPPPPRGGPAAGGGRTSAWGLGG